MLGVDDAAATTGTNRMDGHLMDPMVDAHQPVGDHHSHHLAD